MVGLLKKSNWMKTHRHGEQDNGGWTAHIKKLKEKLNDPHSTPKQLPTLAIDDFKTKLFHNIYITLLNRTITYGSALRSNTVIEKRKLLRRTSSPGMTGVVLL